jgi:hypothetical protein
MERTLDTDTPRIPAFIVGDPHPDWDQPHPDPVDEPALTHAPLSSADAAAVVRILAVAGAAVVMAGVALMAWVVADSGRTDRTAKLIRTLRNKPE